ncbi:hypothetical protein [Rhodococcus sp. MTM3W5.2]|uniref:hypothetical protein n=1 Tax=Rhodococcus sp. MTM3W5.2 TaxID=1805827 RepID=UPI00097CA516|nr:hypothetical protein [Rhodococcus sp. MTM3W5.2]
MPTGDPAGSVPLDLIPSSLIAPRLRKVALFAIVLGVVVAVGVGFFASTGLAVLVGAIIAVPTALSALLTMRRRIWLTGTTIHARHGLRTRSVDASRAVSAEVVVRAARVSQVGVRIGDGNALVSIPLALYTDDGGRELDLLGLRSLADALNAGELAPAVAVASVLIGQLRAEARGAGLEERPLYRAVRTAREAGRVPQTVLTDHEVAGLAD